MDTNTSTAPITELLHGVQRGDARSKELLFQAVFGRLRQIAVAKLRHEKGRLGLEPTELVNELYLQLFGDHVRDFTSRTHFWGVAAHAMRCILVDQARRRKARKRDGGCPVALNDVIPAPLHSGPERVLTFEKLLTQLSEFDPRAAEIVELKVFLGATDQEVAGILGVSSRTVKRDFKTAREWLRVELAAAGLISAPPSPQAADRGGD